MKAYYIWQPINLIGWAAFAKEQQTTITCGGCKRALISKTGRALTAEPIWQYELGGGHIRGHAHEACREHIEKEVSAWRSPRSQNGPSPSQSRSRQRTGQKRNGLPSN